MQQVLGSAKGNRASAARSLGMHRNDLDHLAERLGLR
ncbi:MAG: helix-turn-helix domain-containing protein [Planctomycetota bacterium]